MRAVADHAVLGHGRVLISVRSTILRMATQAELVSIRYPQIISSRPSVRVVAIAATHLSFPQRMVVRQAHLGALAFVTSEASNFCLPSRLHDHLGFRDQILHRAHAALSHHVKARFDFGSRFGVRVSLMTISAPNSIGSVRTCRPGTDFCILRMTTQANSVRVVSRTLPERNDL